jgi:hypothetical protein
VRWAHATAGVLIDSVTAQSTSVVAAYPRGPIPILFESMAAINAFTATVTLLNGSAAVCSDLLVSVVVTTLPGGNLFGALWNVSLFEINRDGALTGGIDFDGLSPGPSGYPLDARFGTGYWAPGVVEIGIGASADDFGWPCVYRLDLQPQAPAQLQLNAARQFGMVGYPHQAGAAIFQTPAVVNGSLAIAWTGGVGSCLLEYSYAAFEQAGNFTLSAVDSSVIIPLPQGYNGTGVWDIHALTSCTAGFSVTVTGAGLPSGWRFPVWLIFVICAVGGATLLLLVGIGIWFATRRSAYQPLP